MLTHTHTYTHTATYCSWSTETEKSVQADQPAWKWKTVTKFAQPREGFSCRRQQKKLSKLPGLIIAQTQRNRKCKHQQHHAKKHRWTPAGAQTTDVHSNSTVPRVHNAQNTTLLSLCITCGDNRQPAIVPVGVRKDQWSEWKKPTKGKCWQIRSPSEKLIKPPFWCYKP